MEFRIRKPNAGLRTRHSKTGFRIRPSTIEFRVRKSTISFLTRQSAVCLLTICIVLFALALTGCGEGGGSSPSSGVNGKGGENEKEKPASMMRDDLMGTVMNITVYGNAGESAILKAWDVIEDIDGRMTANGSQSEIARLNGAPDAGERETDAAQKADPTAASTNTKGKQETDAAKKADPTAASANTKGKTAPLSEDTWKLLEKAIDIATRSGGAFDVSIGGLTELWKKDGSFAVLPSDDRIKSALKSVGVRHIQLLDDWNIRLDDPNTKLDLGGIAKGYACDQAAVTLRNEGVRSALLDLGGNISVIGTKPDGSDWKVGVAAPYPGDDRIALSVTARDQSVVTSGGYQRNFESKGKTWHHILDPKTGYPAESDLLSATILCPASDLADGLSTACFVLGLDGARSLLATYPEAEGIFITKENKIYATGDLKSQIRILDDRFSPGEIEGEQKEADGVR